MRRLKFQTGAIASQAPAPPSFSGARKTCARSERKGLRPIAQILLKLTHCPHSLAATLAALPSMSLIPFAPFEVRSSKFEIRDSRFGFPRTRTSSPRRVRPSAETKAADAATSATTRSTSVCGCGVRFPTCGRRRDRRCGCGRVRSREVIRSGVLRCRRRA